MDVAFHFQPVVIVGAPRSGTNLLRDLLTAFPGVTTWPCDEINLVWRRMNARWPDDALPADCATEAVRRYIRGAFIRQASGDAHTVVEKTCANAVRVDFVNRVVPEAKFIHIVRDGRDAVASALLRWTAGFELRYTLRKARFVPAAEWPFYAWSFLRRRWRRLTSWDPGVRSWGPRFRGIDRWLATQPLPDVAAEQWRQCVVEASRSLAKLPASRVATVRYESLVARPKVELERLLHLTGIPFQPSELAEAVQTVSARNVGKWRTQLDGDVAARLTPLVEQTLQQAWRVAAPTARVARAA